MNVNVPVDELDLKREALKEQLPQIKAIDALLRMTVKERAVRIKALPGNDLTLVEDKEGRSVNLEQNAAIRVRGSSGKDWARYRLFNLATDPDALKINPEAKEKLKDFIDAEEVAFICVGNSGEGAPGLGTFLAEEYFLNPIFTNPNAEKVRDKIAEKSGIRSNLSEVAINSYLNLAQVTR